ncbi:MAG TPA: hypothetical protein VMW31_01840, partial [Devosiaceae bacterium]|nr:hypothetical protein [Devosiaceae bacterium]
MAILAKIRRGIKGNVAAISKLGWQPKGQITVWCCGPAFQGQPNRADSGRVRQDLSQSGNDAPDIEM